MVGVIGLVLIVGGVWFGTRTGLIGAPAVGGVVVLMGAAAAIAWVLTS